MAGVGDSWAHVAAWPHTSIWRSQPEPHTARCRGRVRGAGLALAALQPWLHIHRAALVEPLCHCRWAQVQVGRRGEARRPHHGAVLLLRGLRGPLTTYRDGLHTGPLNMADHGPIIASVLQQASVSRAAAKCNTATLSSLPLHVRAWTTSKSARHRHKTRAHHWLACH